MSDLPIQNAFQLISTKATEIKLDAKGPIPNNSNFNLNYNDAVFGLKDATSTDDKKTFVVEYQIEVTNDLSSFSLRVVFQVLFKCENPLSEAFITSPLIQINARAIGFPFLRSFITTLTSNAGINPIILPSINFAKRNLKEESKA